MKKLDLPVVVKGNKETLAYIFRTLEKEGWDTDWSWNEPLMEDRDCIYLLLIKKGSKSPVMDYHNHSCSGTASLIEIASLEEANDFLGIKKNILTYEIY